MSTWRVLLGFAVRVAALLALEALVLVALAAILPGVETLSFEAALLVVIATALINAALWPLLTRLVLPLTIITFGLASLVLSAGVVALAFHVVDGRSPPFGSDLAIAFALTLIATFVAPALNVEGDVHNPSQCCGMPSATATCRRLQAGCRRVATA
jgi:putative membrane protein